jgi:ribose/xylose/arabinose/galactoside ABC-type transport system permease subunit
MTLLGRAVRNASRHPAALVLVLVVVGAAAADPRFLSTENLFNLLRQMAPTGIIAIGMTVVIIAGGIDLSVGAMVAIAGVIVMAAEPRLGPVLGVLMALAVGILVGLGNGLLVTRGRINPFVGTLGMMTMLRGLALTISNSQTLPGQNPVFARLADFPVLGAPLSAVLWIVFLAGGHYVLTRTVAGRAIFAVGGNLEASRLAGLNVNRSLYLAYVAPALMAAAAGVLIASQINSGSPVLGNETPLYAIAAVLLGGASMRGGAGSLLGTLQGVLILGVLRNALNVAGVGGYYQILIVGLLLVATILFDQLLARRRERNIA